mmetsp:Transcript_22953/g.34804  ORF Transcript_22953/g.34804 Transcript_22953/m.34804 type:complete len:172 (-) Transcript_22953:67-582(-)
MTKPYAKNITKLYKPEPIVSCPSYCFKEKRPHRRIKPEKMKEIIQGELKKSEYGRKLLLGRKLFKKEKIDDNHLKNADDRKCVELYLEHRAARRLIMLRFTTDHVPKRLLPDPTTSLEMSEISGHVTPSRYEMNNPIEKSLLLNVSTQEILRRAIAEWRLRKKLRGTVPRF